MENNATTDNVTTSGNNSTTAVNQSNTTTSIQQLDDDMEQLLSLDKPYDIATLAYIRGVPLIVMGENANVNGWSVNTKWGKYSTDYLLRGLKYY